MGAVVSAVDRCEGPLERGEALGVPGQQLGTTAQLERAPGERVLRPHRALVQCPRGREIGGQHDVGLADTRPDDERGDGCTVGAEVHPVAGVAAGTVHERLDRERRIGVHPVGRARGRVESGDPGIGQELHHERGCYRRVVLPRSAWSLPPHTDLARLPAR